MESACFSETSVLNVEIRVSHSGTGENSKISGKVCHVDCLTLKTEALRSSEPWVNIRQSSSCGTPEGFDLHHGHCNNKVRNSDYRHIPCLSRDRPTPSGLQVGILRTGTIYSTLINVVTRCFSPSVAHQNGEAWCKRRHAPDNKPALLYLEIGLPTL